MERWLAIAAYRCLIDGQPTGSIDFQVRYFVFPTASHVEDALRAEEPLKYENGDGQTVSWPLSEIFEIQGLILPRQSGSEIVGFIAQTNELAKLGG